MNQNQANENPYEQAQKRFDESHKKIVSIIQDYVASGYAQTLAKLLVYIGPEQAKETLSRIPEGARGSVEAAYRELSQKKNTDADIISEAGAVLKKADFYGRTLAFSVIEGLSPEASATFSKESERYFSSDPLLTLNIESYSISFEDILELDDRATQKMLREVEQMDMAKALKGEDSELQDKIFRNMSRRAAAMLKEDIEFMGPVRLEDIAASQKKVCDIIRRLVDGGEIVLPKDNTLVF